MPDPIPTVDPKRALSDLGEPNKPTVTTSAPPPAPKAGALHDKNGNAFDELAHARDKHGNPMMRADGNWMAKRGNGALKLRGQPLAGSAGKGFVSVAPKPTAVAGDAAAPTPGASGAVVNALPAPDVGMLTEADYEPTAIGVTNGGFSLMQLVFGKAWEPDANERATWNGALKRLWFHYQLPRVGPIIEVLLLIPATIAKRRDDARTKEGWGKVKAWCGIKPKPKPDAQAERAVA